MYGSVKDPPRMGRVTALAVAFCALATIAAPSCSRELGPRDLVRKYKQYLEANDGIKAYKLLSERDRGRLPIRDFLPSRRPAWEIAVREHTKCRFAWSELEARRAVIFYNCAGPDAIAMVDKYIDMDAVINLIEAGNYEAVEYEEPVYCVKENGKWRITVDESYYEELGNY